MPKISLPMTEEEQHRRNKLLRMKKRGIQGALLILILVISALIYMLQKYEHVAGQTLYIVVIIMTVILCAGMLMYRRFARLINLDMNSSEKIITTGIVVRSNFIGNTVYNTRVYNNDNQKYITLDIDGRWVTLSGLQLKRLLYETYQANRIYLRDEFQVEMTPYGRHIIHLQRL